MVWDVLDKMKSSADRPECSLMFIGTLCLEYSISLF